jgi:hypothetical protein
LFLSLAFISFLFFPSLTIIYGDKTKERERHTERKEEIFGENENLTDALHLRWDGGQETPNNGKTEGSYTIDV